MDVAINRLFLLFVIIIVTVAVVQQINDNVCVDVAANRLILLFVLIAKKRKTEGKRIEIAMLAPIPRMAVYFLVSLAATRTTR